MKTVVAVGKNLSKNMDLLGGAVLVGMVFITVIDVAMRYFGHPFMGTYELVGMAGAVAIGCGIAETTVQDGNVRVDILAQMLSVPIRKVLTACTSLLGITVFALLGYSLMVKGAELRAANEATMTLGMVIYPVVYALGACSFVQAFAIICALIWKLHGGSNHE